MLNFQFDNNPGQVKKWMTHDLLSFLLHSKYSGSCIVNKHQHSSSSSSQQTGHFQQIIEAFIINRVDGANFFNFESESQMLKVLGDKVKALGVRKNLMRIVRKLRQLEEKIEADKQREREARQASLRYSDQIKKNPINQLTSFSDHLDADDLDRNLPPQVLTSKSQQTNNSQGGVFKWANISGVQEAVSGAMSGLSAYMGWV